MRRSRLAFVSSESAGASLRVQRPRSPTTRPTMNVSRLAAAMALALALPASGADLLTLYREARHSDPVWQSARAQAVATAERVPQARPGYPPQIAASGSIFHNHVDFQLAPSLAYSDR